MTDKLILLVDNEVGVLVKIASMFAAKNCNIEAITSEHTEDPTLLKLTLEVSGSEAQVPRLCNLFEKIIPVRSVKRA